MTNKQLTDAFEEALADYQSRNTIPIPNSAANSSFGQAPSSAWKLRRPFTVTPLDGPRKSLGHLCRFILTLLVVVV